MNELPSKEVFRKWFCDSLEIDDRIRDSLKAIGEFNHDLEQEGSYPYIPMGACDKLYELFSRILQLPGYRRKFLDVGCGTGRIVKLAQKCGIPAKGIEYHSPYIKLGEIAFEFSSGDLIEKNAFELDYNFLKDFDIIYTYMPLYDREKMSKFHVSMVCEAKFGTIFVEMLPSYYPMNEFFGTRNQVDLWDAVPFAAVQKKTYD